MPAMIMMGAASSCTGVCQASTEMRHSGLASRAVPSAATNTTKIVPTYAGSDPRWVKVVVQTATRAMPRRVAL